MSRKKREHKGRAGAKVSSNGVYFAFKRALNKQKLLTESEKSHLMISPYLSMSALVKHDGGESQCLDLEAALTIGRLLSSRSGAVKSVAAFDAGLEALWRMRSRANDTGAWGFDGDADGVDALNTCLGLYDQQVSLVTHKEFEDAGLGAYKVIDSNKRRANIENFEVAA